MNLRSLYNAFVVTLLMASAAIIGFGNPTPLAAQRFSANLEPVAGLVQYKAADNSEWETLASNQLINPGDQIRTGSNGHAVLTTPTGIEVLVFPTTLVQLAGLELLDSGGQLFSMYQLIGTTFTDVQTRNAKDAVLVSIPTAGMIVRGTQFLTMVLPDNPNPEVSAAVLGAEDTVQVVAANKQQYEVIPDTAFYSRVNLSPITVANLGANVRTTLFKTAFGNLAGFGNNLTTFKDFLTEMLQGDNNSSVRSFLRNLLGLEAPRDSSDISDILEAIDELAANDLKLPETIKGLIDFWVNIYSRNLTADLAPETCGNGEQDEDETAENCPDDFADPALCGNNICETSDEGESLLNCPLDCYIDEASALAAVQINGQNITQLIIGGGVPPTPRASGVGNR